MSTFTKKAAAVSLTAVTALSMSGFGSFVSVAHGQTVAELQAQNAALQATITSLTQQIANLSAQLSQLLNGGSTGGTSTGGTTTTSGQYCAWVPSTVPHTVGSRGDEVMNLQKLLNANGYAVATSGVGSMGSETTYFGSLTASALASWQADNGVSPAVGYYGPITRSAMQSVYCTTTTTPTNPTNPTTPTNPTVPVTGMVSTMLVPSGGPSVIPSGAFYAPVATLRVTNGTNQQIQFTGATVRRTGILGDSQVSGVLVTDGAGRLHGNLVTFGQSVAMPGFGSDPIYIAPGTSEDITFNVNLTSTATTGTIGMQFSSAADLMIWDMNGNAVTPTGTFPMMSDTIGIVSGSGSLGALTVESRTRLGGSEASPIEIDQGSTDVDVAEFQLEETTGNEDVELTNIEVTQNGSASGDDLTNIRLVDNENNVVATVSRLINNTAKFSITGMTGDNAGPHGGYLIEEGQERNFTVRVDTAVNSNSANRTINFVVQSSEDIRAVGAETNVGVGVSAGGSQTFSIGDDDDSGKNYAKFRPGSISVSRATDSPSGKVAQGASNQVLANFRIDAFGEPIEIQRLTYIVEDASGNAFGVGDRALGGVLTIENDKGGVIFSRTASDLANYGTGGCTVSSGVFATGTCTGTPSQTNLSSFYTINPGTVGRLTFKADIEQDATSTDGYRVRLISINFRKLSSNNFSTTSVSVNGNGLTVEGSSLTVTKSSSFNPTNMVTGGAEQEIGRFDIQSGAAQGQQINAIKVRIGGSASAVDTSGEFDSTTTANLQAVSNVILRVDGVNVGGTAKAVNTTAGDTFSTNFFVPANSTKQVSVHAVVSTGFTADNLGTELTVTSATGAKSQTTQSVAATIGQSIATAASGILLTSALADSTVNIAKIINTNEKNVPIFMFKGREAFNREPLIIQKGYFGIVNAENKLKDFRQYIKLPPGVGAMMANKLPPGALNQEEKDWLTQTDELPVGEVTQIVNGELKFAGVNMTTFASGFQIPGKIEKGGEATVVVRATPVDPSGLVVDSNPIRLGQSFLEFVGETSGATTRYSGGSIVGFDSASEEIQVHNIEQFAVNTFINIDANADGQFTTNFDDGDGGTGIEINEALPYCITDIDTANSEIKIAFNTGSFDGTDTSTFCDLAGGGADLTAVNIRGTEVGGGWSGAPFSSAQAVVHEIEPIITSHSGISSGAQVPENVLGSFKIENDGARAMTVQELRFSIEHSANVNAGYGPKNFKLDRAFSDGTRNANTMSSSSALSSPTLVYTLTGAKGDAQVAATEPAGETTIAVDQGTGSGATYTLTAGDRITFTGDTNGGVGYKVVSTSTTAIVITPGLQNGISDNASTTVVSSNPTIGATSVLESGSVIQFDLVTAGLTEEVPANSSQSYVVLADTTNIKNNGVQSTASTQVRMLGSKASTTALATDGLQWAYTSSRTGSTVGPLTISESYIVTGENVVYR